MNVLSLFDGMSCGQVALERAGIKVKNYYASEIDKYAITVTQANYPNTVQLGNIKTLSPALGTHDLPDKIDLVMGGSPCQGFSYSGKQLAFDDPRSKLFFEFVRVLNEVREKNPNVKFLLENVKMKKEFQDVITSYMGVEPIQINSALVSAQNRIRLYWTNIEGVRQPADRGILLRDVIEGGTFDQDLEHLRSVGVGLKQIGFVGKNRQGERIYSIDGKATTLSANGGGPGARTGLYAISQTARGFNRGGLKALDGKTPTLTSNAWEQNNKLIKLGHIGKEDRQSTRVYSVEGKSATLNAGGGGQGAKTGLYEVGPKVFKDKSQTVVATIYKENAKSMVKRNKLGLLVKEYNPASIVGRRINERGVREDYNPKIPIVQCLQVKDSPNKMGCLTTVGKDTLLSDLPPGRYPLNSPLPENIRKKSKCVRAGGRDSYDRHEGDSIDKNHVRKLTPIECERLQTLPDNYSNYVSNTQRYKMLGNGWNVETIVEILECYKLFD